MAVPKLRFKANDGSEFPEWEEKTIGEIATKVDRKANEGSTAPVMMISQGNGFIFQSEKYSRENSGQSLKKYTLLQNGEMAYNHGASKACPYGITYPLVEVAEARVPFVYHCFSLASKENQGFWKLALNSSNVNRQLKKMVSSSVRDDGLLNISFDTYMDAKVWHPSIPEQNKIADCMFILDTVIANCRSEVDVWEKYKRGVMQQLFSQEVRFKADDGNEYPRWELRRLKDIGFPLTDLLDPQKYPDDFFTEYSMPAFDRNQPDIVKGSEMSSTRKILSRPCVLINKLNVRKKRIWAVSNPENNAVCSAEFVPITPNGLVLEYLHHYALSDKFTAYLMENSSGSSNSQKRVTPETIMDAIIPYPCLEEQQKIADCLSAFDEVIDKAKQKLEAYKQLKKGLLQQMFV